MQGRHRADLDVASGDGLDTGMAHIDSNSLEECLSHPSAIL